MTDTNTDTRATVVVIGHGMVGHRFCEALAEQDTDKRYRMVTFCEEPRAAYDRVGLTSFFAHRDAQQLMLARIEWYREQGIELHIGDRAVHIDRERKTVTSAKGCSVAYDHVVMATGSTPFVPPVPGIEKQGVFVYRTIEDLERIIAYADGASSAAVIGGGLLGLEAAKAVYDLGLDTHVIERSSRLMTRQLDDAGSDLLVDRIASLGVRVHLERSTESVLGNGKVTGLRYAEGGELDVDMVIVATGIRPRDELASACGLALGERGGVEIDRDLRSSDPDIFAIGEVASRAGMVYGLVAPGYEMAEALAANLCGGDCRFDAGDLSTKLKLMGVDVASFGAVEGDAEDARSLAFEDPIAGVYKKLVFNRAGTRLRGGMLVGDAADYGTLLALSKTDADLPAAPSALIGMGGGSDALSGPDALPDDAQVCSCNAVTKGTICSAIREQNLDSVDAVKACTKAGAGCGGCMPMVSTLLQHEMLKAGVSVRNTLCEHFDHSRQELYHLVQVKEHRSFEAILAAHGRGMGCEICKPTIASILASLWGEHVVAHSTIQDTNDRFLANIQRRGLYSVVPRVPGGEITPDGLITLGRIARAYGLYTKITGGQRIDLFGARVDQLPDIWEELIEAGFDSGQAYGKSMRTVKSCVGSTWCRYGVQDAVGFAIQVEERYRGLRAPHKLKSAVSGCVRECAEAQSKDFGLIATEQGWNLYVGGNGGAKPRHADLLASDLDADTCIRYIDRFLMFYIRTAEKLTRTASWLEQLEGGIDYLKAVVIEDSLGIAEDLEAHMQRLVDSYECEWKAVVESPSKRAQFKAFANQNSAHERIEWVEERGQRRPKDWARDRVSTQAPPPAAAGTEWMPFGRAQSFPRNAGTTVRYGETQIAVFRFADQSAWYATQNLCPHKHDMVLARGLTGDADGIPKVACPLHKKTFSLETGEGLSDTDYSIATFPVKEMDGDIYISLPPESELAHLNACDHAAEASLACAP